LNELCCLNRWPGPSIVVHNASPTSTKGIRPLASTPEEEREEWLRQMQAFSPEQRAAMEKVKAAVERHVQRAKESEQQMRQEMKQIAAAHPGQLGGMAGESEEK